MIIEISMKDPRHETIFKAAYDKMEGFTKDRLLRTVDEYSGCIEKKITDIIQRENIDCLMVHNIWSLGMNIAAARAFYNAVKKTGIRAIGHHHDFYWERDRYSNPAFPFVGEFLDRYHPPSSPNTDS